MLRTHAQTLQGYAVMRLSGVLHAATYRQARDAVIKAALDQTTAVIIDVNELDVRDEGSWAVFTSARWHVKPWPDVTIALACRDHTVRRLLTRLSITRYVPVFATVSAAAAAIGSRRCRYDHRARAHVAPQRSSIRGARVFVRDNLAQWSMTHNIPVAITVANIFVENALSYTDDGCEVRLESTEEDGVVIAVSDTSTTPAVRRERTPGSLPAGLDVVAALCGQWGNVPTTTGKTVWAKISPDDTIGGIAELLL
ncbi:MAG: STAS domain-containing protein [Mycobacterium sp.]|uniref:STAS domain-containing protein n=1 Tax=Mycobacterium sp. TaxID=1785 RepID=UPI003CC563B3